MEHKYDPVTKLVAQMSHEDWIAHMAEHYVPVIEVKVIPPAGPGDEDYEA